MNVIRQLNYLCEGFFVEFQMCDSSTDRGAQMPLPQAQYNVWTAVTLQVVFTDFIDQGSSQHTWLSCESEIQGILNHLIALGTKDCKHLSLKLLISIVFGELGLCHAQEVSDFTIDMWR